MVRHTKYIKEVINVQASNVLGDPDGVLIADPDGNTIGDGSSGTICRRHFMRRVLADIAVVETYTKRLKRVIKETIGVYGAVRLPANAVMYDLCIRSDALTRALLDNVTDSPPVGYTPFRELHPGDYPYRYGIVGVRVTGAQNQGRAGINGLQLNVDVEDVVERGTVAVSTTDPAGQAVLFTKVFTTPPEVFPQFISGDDPAIAEIVPGSVTTTGFSVILRDITAPSTLLLGDVKYSAIGR